MCTISAQSATPPIREWTSAGRLCGSLLTLNGPRPRMGIGSPTCASTARTSKTHMTWPAIYWSVEDQALASPRWKVWEIVSGLGNGSSFSPCTGRIHLRSYFAGRVPRHRACSPGGWKGPWLSSKGGIREEILFAFNQQAKEGNTTFMYHGHHHLSK